MASADKFPEIMIGIEGEPGVTLGPEATIALWSIAHRNGISCAEAIAVSVLNDNFLHEQVEAGGKLLVKRGNTIRHLYYS